MSHRFFAKPDERNEQFKVYQKFFGSRSVIRSEVIRAVCDSTSFQCETENYLRRGGVRVSREPRLFKYLEDNLVRVVFPTLIEGIDEGTVVALTTLYDLTAQENIYAHTICAGPGVNTLLKAIYSPLGQAKPQAGVAGDKAIAKFVAWKEAAWTKFLNDELELGNKAASEIWIENFWKALDRMFGGGAVQY